MIQRIQSLYLLGVFLVCLGSLLYFFDIFSADFYSKNDQFLPILQSGILFLSSILAFFCIFLYKNRKKQFVLNRIIILFQLVLLSVLVYATLNSFGEKSFSEKSVLVVVPFVSIVLLFLANKAILKDENLVKSVDRLR